MKLRRFAYKAVNRALLKAGLSLTVNRHDMDSYFRSERQRRMLIDDTASAMDQFLREQSVFPVSGSDRIGALVDEFFGLYRRRSQQYIAGGSGFNSLLWLFVLARLLQPRLIVESGVFTGSSTWALRQGAPDARIESFDLDLGMVAYRDGNAFLHEHDWSEFRFDRVDPETTLCFFDDHVDQVRRVIEAGNWGMRYLIFDDNTPLRQLHQANSPEFAPMFDFMFDATLQPEEVVAWTIRGRELEWKCDADYLQKGRAWVDDHCKVADLSQVNTMMPTTPLTLVRIKSALELPTPVR